MKTLCILCLGWLLLDADICASARVPPASLAAELRTHLNTRDYGKFDGHGKLVFQKL